MRIVVFLRRICLKYMQLDPFAVLCGILTLVWSSSATWVCLPYNVGFSVLNHCVMSFVGKKGKTKAIIHLSKISLTPCIQFSLRCVLCLINQWLWSNLESHSDKAVLSPFEKKNTTTEIKRGNHNTKFIFCVISRHHIYQSNKRQINL